ncbi:MAG: GIY-YIG nuclease family protein [Deltaproteobacteria bacterium]|nr:GIY-YIG nuclease family protein [Deltaproteobacteria bacterium]
MHQYFVYIMANRRNGTLYTGVTNDLRKRVLQHKHGTFDGFTRRYQVHRLVYFERHGDIRVAIRREKRIKRWRRAWKLTLIESKNPKWDDLFALAYPESESITPTGTNTLDPGSGAGVTATESM